MKEVIVEQRKPSARPDHEPESSPNQVPIPDEYTNPAGLGRDACDDPAVAEPCESESLEDMALGETMPGQGIPGYDAEEDGGG